MQKTCTRPNVTYDHAKKTVTKQSYTMNATVLNEYQSNYISCRKDVRELYNSRHVSHGEYNTVRFVWSHQLQMNRTYNIVPVKQRNPTSTIFVRDMHGNANEKCVTMQAKCGCLTMQPKCDA